MPCILHIETSTKVCSVALSEDGKLLYHHEDYDGPSHSETSGVYVDEALSFANSHAIPVDAVAVGETVAASVVNGEIVAAVSGDVECFIVGLVLGIIGLVLGNKAQKIYYATPELYTGEGMFKAGRITSIIGIVFGAISTVGGLIASIVAGGSLFFLPDLLENFM